MATVWVDRRFGPQISLDINEPGCLRFVLDQECDDGPDLHPELRYAVYYLHPSGRWIREVHVPGGRTSYATEHPVQVARLWLQHGAYLTDELEPYRQHATKGGYAKWERDAVAHFYAYEKSLVERPEPSKPVHEDDDAGRYILDRYLAGGRLKIIVNDTNERKLRAGKIGSVQHMKQLMLAYCKRRGIDPPPPRK